MDEINAATGYANGNLFADAAEVTAYFTPAAQTAMFGQEAETDADTLDGWAAEVIRTGHHMTTTTTTPTAYGVFYCGAPYGDNETGELVSTHRSLQAADFACGKLRGSPKYYGSNSRVMAKVNGEWVSTR